MTQLPAVVTFQDLPTGTTLSGQELLAAVQTSGGVANTIQVPISSLMTTGLGALPTAGNTGQILQKASATNFSAQWANINTVVLSGSGLATSGNATTLTVGLASVAGLSVIGVAATGSAVPAAITGTGAQVVRVNDAGTVLGFGAVNLGSSAAVTGVLPGANVTAANLALLNAAGGVQGFLPGTAIVSASIAGTAIATGTIFTTQLQTAAGLSVLAVNSTNASNFSVISGTAGQVLAVNPGGTGVAFRGGMVLLNTLLPNNVATVGDTTSFSGAFSNYMFVFENVVPATTDMFSFQIATSGSTFISANYSSFVSVLSGSVATSTEGASQRFNLSGNTATTQVATTTSYGFSGQVVLYNAGSSAAKKIVRGQAAWISATTLSSASLLKGDNWGIYDGATSSISAVQFLFAAANIATGIIKIYGMA